MRDLPATSAPPMRHVQSYLLLVGDVGDIRETIAALHALAQHAQVYAIGSEQARAGRGEECSSSCTS